MLAARAVARQYFDGGDTLQKPTWSHFGVYGLIRQGGKILLVRKTRGPYTGLLDLPGGSPDPSDRDTTATLRREIAEETGLSLTQPGRWHDFSFLVTRDTGGREIELRHSGVWTTATTLPIPSPAPGATVAASDTSGDASGDTSGIVWIDVTDWRKRRDLSKLVQVVLAQADDLEAIGHPSRG
jgi:8-oxo-dGTP pyrophosphatase MutT (NUDIX family)